MLLRLSRTLPRHCCRRGRGLSLQYETVCRQRCVTVVYQWTLSNRNTDNASISTTNIIRCLLYVVFLWFCRRHQDLLTYLFAYNAFTDRLFTFLASVLMAFRILIYLISAPRRWLWNKLNISYRAVSDSNPVRRIATSYVTCKRLSIPVWVDLTWYLHNKQESDRVVVEYICWQLVLKS